jgi:hypothetical protein
MRLTGLLGVLLSACTIDNPFFDITPDSADTTDGSSTATTRATTGTPTASDPTTGVSSTPGETTETTQPETTQPATPGTGDSESDSEGTSDTTTDPDTGMTTMDPPDFVCPVLTGLPPDRLVTYLQGAAIQCPDGKTEFIGEITMIGDVLQFIEVTDCVSAQPVYEYKFGQEWMPIPIDAKCTSTSIYWDKSTDECKIGTIIVQDFTGGVLGDYFLVASFAPLPVAAASPLKPELGVPFEVCECPPEMMNCCPNGKPGNYTLNVGGINVPPTQNKPVPIEGGMMKLHNIASYIDDACVADPAMHIEHKDWVATPVG